MRRLYLEHVQFNLMLVHTGTGRLSSLHYLEFRYNFVSLQRAHRTKMMHGTNHRYQYPQLLFETCFDVVLFNKIKNEIKPESVEPIISNANSLAPIDFIDNK
jgi:hypothetical protein